MTGSLAPAIPAIGQPNTTEDPDIKSGMETLRDGLNAILNSDNTVMGMQNYRTIYSADQAFFAEKVAGTYLIGNLPVAKISGANLEGGENFKTFDFDDADWVISGKTLKMRLRAQIAANATKPAFKFTVGLYPITVAGGSNLLVPTLGAVVSGSTIEFNEPAASTITRKEASDFTIPADGAYVLGVVTSAKQTANNVSNISAQLQVRNV